MVRLLAATSFNFSFDLFASIVAWLGRMPSHVHIPRAAEVVKLGSPLLVVGIRNPPLPHQNSHDPCRKFNQGGTNCILAHGKCTHGRLHKCSACPAFGCRANLHPYPDAARVKASRRQLTEASIDSIELAAADVAADRADVSPAVYGSLTSLMSSLSHASA